MPVIMKSIYKPDEYEKIDMRDIDKIVTLIQTGDEYNLKETTDKIRACKDGKKKKSLKLQLPCINLGDFDGKVVNKNFKKAFHMIYDIDHIPAERMEETKEILKKYAYMYFVSPSGNGIKFAIRINDNQDIDTRAKLILPITDEIKFRETYRNNLHLFEHELNINKKEIKQYYDCGGKESGLPEPMEIDAKCEDPRRSPFLCYDPECFFNPDSHIFPSFDPFVLTESTMRSYLAAPDSDQLKQICLYLSHLDTPLTYDEWIRIGMALYNEPDGFLYWKAIPPSESYRWMNEEQLKKKFQSFSTGGGVSIATLYYIAIQKGYNLVAGGADNRYPFLSVTGRDLAKKGVFQPMEDIGFDFQKRGEDEYNWITQVSKNKSDVAFQWQCLLPEGIKEDEDGRQQKIFNMNGEYIPIRNESMSNSQKFKTAIMETAKKVMFMPATSETAYNRLFEYICKAKAKKVFYMMKNIGHIDDKVWNLGNICVINGNVVPADEIINIDDNVYMLQMTKDIHINMDRDKLITALNALVPYYPDLPLMLGWVTAHIFTRNLIKDNIKLPLLFLYGVSGSGKSTLAEIIFLLHGVHPSSMDEFKISMATRTSSAGRDRMRQILYSIPLHIDEYHDSNWEEFKAMYDRSSAVKARVKSEKGYYKMGVTSGTVVSAVNPPIRSETEELVNRCMYIETTKKTHKVYNDKDFYDIFWENKDFLSNYIIEVILNYHYDEFIANYLRLRKDSFLAKIKEKDSRIDNNFRLCMAGWEFAKQFFPDYQEKEFYWQNKYIELVKWCKGRGVAYKFARVLCRLYHHQMYTSKFNMRNSKIMFEDEEYRFVSFVLNNDIWQIAVEVDRRGEQMLAGVTLQQVEESFKNEYPAQLKSINSKTGKYNVALRVKELEMASDVMYEGVNP